MEQVITSIIDRFETWSPVINALGVAGTLFFTLLLVELYRQQKNLLRDSFNADHRAVVEVEEYTVNGDRLTVTLSNVGNGVATDLELVTATAFEETGHLSPGAVTNRLMMKDDLEVRRGRRSIKAHEDRSEFEARPSLALTYSNDYTDRVGIRTGMDELEEVGVELVRVHWFLRYQDLRGTYSLGYIDGIEVEERPDGNEFEERNDTEWIVLLLDENDDRAWKAAGTADQLELDTDSVSAILSRLKEPGLVRHKHPYWAITDNEDRLRVAYRLTSTTRLQTSSSARSISRS